MFGVGSTHYFSYFELLEKINKWYVYNIFITNSK